MKPILHCTFDPFFLREVMEADFEQPLTIWIDRLEHLAPGSRHVLIVMEPDPISRLREQVVRLHERYEHVFTFDEELLQRLSNAVRLEFGTTWIAGDEVREKSFGISMVYGAKRMLEGHRLRGTVFRRRREIRMPRRFFLSGRPQPRRWRLETAWARRWDCAVLGASKGPVFASQFHIAIENCRVTNYFTEKLIDCFVTRTVPLYWGCPNIGDFFNLDGMLLFDTADELIDRANRLAPADYERLQGAVEDNFERAQDFAAYGPRLLRRLRQLGYR